MSNSERTYFGEVSEVRIAGNLSEDKNVANITFIRYNRNNGEEEVTITVNRALATRFAYYLNKVLEGESGQYVEFW